MLFVRCAGGISHHPDESVDGGRRRAGDRGGDAVRRGLCAERLIDLSCAADAWSRPDGVGAPTSASPTARSRPSSPSSPAAARGARRARSARPPRRRSTRTCTSTSPAGRTGRGSRPAARRSAAGGVHGVLRHAAQLDAADRSTAPAFDAKLRGRAGAPRCVDFGLWGGLVPGNVDRLEELAERGVIGFKAFMSNSGIDEFRHADDVDALRGHGEAARLGLPGRRARRERRADARAPRGADARATSSASRPVVAELEAIGRAIALRRGHRLRAAHRPRLQRPRRRAGRRGARARRRRDLRDLPALPVADARTTSRRSARSPSARRRCAPRAEREAAVGAAARRRGRTWSPPTTRPRRRT